jgi:large subunit ribosomal protein L4
MALSSKVQSSEIVVLDKLELKEIKTRKFVDVLNALKVKNALIITDKKDEILELSSRNVPHVKVLRSEGLNVYDVLKYHTLVLLEPALKNIEERLVA